MHQQLKANKKSLPASSEKRIIEVSGGVDADLIRFRIHVLGQSYVFVLDV